MGPSRDRVVDVAKLPTRASVVPLAFAVAILSVILAAALGPATGTVQAASSCQYGTCTNNGPGLLTYGVGVLLAIIILLIAAAVIYQRRRGGGGGSPPASGGDAVAAWNGPPGGPQSPPAAETPSYIEGPGDVAAGAAAGAAVGAGAAAEAEPADIDSLMGELDRISGEILKRGPGKKGPGSPGDADPDVAPPDA
jgi:hypothetical protein